MFFKKHHNVSLSQRLYQGEDGAFEEIIDAYWNLLFYRAFKILKNTDDVEDILQNVFADLWARKYEKIVLNLEAFLVQAVKFQVFKKMRDGKLLQSHMEQFEEIVFYSHVEETVEKKETSENITQVIENLPSRCKEVFKLSRYENLTNKEIAYQLSISVKTVENQITKANSTIRSTLKEILS